MVMKAAIYARVSTERQAERGTIGSQVEALRAHLAAAGADPAGEYCDDGCSGARLDRPGLDTLRDAAEAGLFEVVYCLSPDRLARSYAYQVLILDELARFGVRVAFTDAPGLDQDDPQARLLTQVQGVIAEYERAKIGERYRRGKLFRARAGEVISWKAPYGYRRIPRGPDGPAHLETFEPEAVIARRIFAERAAGTTIRQICRQLNADAVPTPTGSRSVWGTSTLGRILGNEAYIGRTYFNRTEAVPDRRPGHRSRQVPRPRSEWIAISCPAIIADETFEAAAKASADNAQWSPRRAEPGAWLLRGLVKCGPCGVGTSCHKMRGRNGTWHRYYYCHNHDPLRAGGQDRRCPERNIRADALDEFVFAQIRAALLDPGLLLAGEQAITIHAPVPDDQLLAAELARLDRKLETARGEHNRLIDLYQAGLVDMPELQRRAAAITARQSDLQNKRTSLAAERANLARGNRLRRGVEHFAARVAAVIDQLNPAQRQKLLRLLIEDVQVTGWHIQIRLRIPLDDPPDSGPPHGPGPLPNPAHSDGTTTPVSTKDRLRSLHEHERTQLPAHQTTRARRDPRHHHHAVKLEAGQDLINYLTAAPLNNVTADTQPVRQRQHLSLGGAEAAGLLHPPRRIPIRWHPDRRHQPSLADVDAAHPVPVQRLVGHLFHVSLTSAFLHLLACEVVPPGEPGGERRNLTRVLVATMNGPWEDRFPASG
jgi:site-specific DNA recombinase